jgi:transcriptional regulator with XRE-family HTH domain
VNKRGPKTKAKQKSAFHIALGRRIRLLRKEAGYTSHEMFAHELGFARAQYLSYENGREMQISNLLRIVKAHKLTMAQFFSEGFDDLIVESEQQPDV